MRMHSLYRHWGSAYAYGEAQPIYTLSENVCHSISHRDNTALPLFHANIVFNKSKAVQKMNQSFERRDLYLIQLHLQIFASSLAHPEPLVHLRLGIQSCAWTYNLVAYRSMPPGCIPWYLYVSATVIADGIELNQAWDASFGWRQFDGGVFWVVWTRYGKLIQCSNPSVRIYTV